MAKEFPCIETTIDLTIDPFIIRLWIDKEGVPMDYDIERAMVEQIRHHFWENVLGRAELIKYLVALPNINAVQITDKDGNPRYGTVIYTVDFNSDHG